VVVSGIMRWREPPCRGGKSHLADNCEKARAEVQELSFGEFFLDGIGRRQLAISMRLGARGAGM
jgi:hypothetical protein